MGHKCVLVDDTMEPAPVLDLDASLFEAFAAVSRNDAVLIQSPKKRICGIVTAYDVSETFGTLVEPFLLIEEVEKHVRAILQDHVVEAELMEAVSIKKAADSKAKISDLNFGGYILLLKKVEVWNRLGLNLEQAVFVQSHIGVKATRNDVMHFRPTGIGVQKLAKLRNFAKCLREIRLLKKLK